VSDRGRAILTLRQLRKTVDAGEARQIIADALPPLLASVLPQGDLDTMRQRLDRLPIPQGKPKLATNEWLAAVGVFLLVFMSTLPVVVPFIFINEARIALRISNGIAIAMLFLSGYALGVHSGQHPWALGLSMVVVGILLTGVAILLGG
jgi:VIT1/CCC1 family predicted Fe2+/Mn2+ transporter